MADQPDELDPVLVDEPLSAVSATPQGESSSEPGSEASGEPLPGDLPPSPEVTPPFVDPLPLPSSTDERDGTVAGDTCLPEDDVVKIGDPVDDGSSSPVPAPSTSPLASPSPLDTDCPLCLAPMPTPENFKDSPFYDPNWVDPSYLAFDKPDQADTDLMVGPGPNVSASPFVVTNDPPEPSEEQQSALGAAAAASYSGTVSHSRYVKKADYEAPWTNIRLWGYNSPAGSQTAILQVGAVCSGTGMTVFAGYDDCIGDNELLTNRVAWWLYGFNQNASHKGSGTVHLVIGTNNSGTTNSTVMKANANNFFHHLYSETAGYAQTLNNQNKMQGRGITYKVWGGDDVEQSPGYNSAGGSLPWIRGFDSAAHTNPNKYLGLIVDSFWGGGCDRASCWDVQSNYGWTPHNMYDAIWGIRVSRPFPQHYSRGQGKWYAYLNKAALAVGKSQPVYRGVLWGCGEPVATDTSPQQAYGEFVAETGKYPTYLTWQHNQAHTC